MPIDRRINRSESFHEPQSLSHHGFIAFPGFSSIDTNFWYNPSQPVTKAVPTFPIHSLNDAHTSPSGTLTPLSPPERGLPPAETELRIPVPSAAVEIRDSGAHAYR
ncbi:hypothetical protein B7494_g3092 [Chlorociboria aeruginascens]|nr:hypothetical protein B7494_g3092 [Chlorociboria aeruginascens]